LRCTAKSRERGLEMEMQSDDYTIAEQDEQRRRLLEDLEDAGMLEPWAKAVLKGPEATVGGGAHEEAHWLRRTIWEYHEMGLDLSSVLAEVHERAGKSS
jgi:hypothetical protein